MAMVYRLWAAARGPEVHRWMDEVDPAMAGGRRGAAADLLSLELGVFAEAEVASGGAVAAAFLDVSKAYEGVDHCLLARAALASGYPPCWPT